VLNIRCHIESALRVTSCHLHRIANGKQQQQCRHHHLESCDQNETKIAEFQKASEEYQANSVQSGNSQVFHSHYDGDISAQVCPGLDVTRRTSHTSGSDSHCNVKTPAWFHVDRAIVGQLNDWFWLENCLRALHQLINQQTHHQQQQVQLLILSKSPSMFSIAALRLGLVSGLCFLDLDPVHWPLIGHLLSANSVGERHVTYGRPWQRDDVITGTVLFADIVSSDGCLQPDVFESLTEARHDTFYCFCCLL